MVHVTPRDSSADYRMLIRRCGGKVQLGSARHGKLDNMSWLRVLGIGLSCRILRTIRCSLKFHKSREFFDELNNYQLVEDSAPWSLLYDDVLTQMAFRHPLQVKKKCLLCRPCLLIHQLLNFGFS
jgi:hypothetical protein